MLRQEYGKRRLRKALYKGKKKQFVKTLKAVRKCALNEKAVNECEEYALNNWDSAVFRMQDKNVYGVVVQSDNMLRMDSRKYFLCKNIA